MVGINNLINVVLLVIRILGVFVLEYQQVMKKYQVDMEEVVIVKGIKLREGGDVVYLVGMKKQM